jgi:hypothetical protein
MKHRQQNTTAYPIPFFMVDSADHVAGKTGLTPTVTLSKNGAAFASPAGGVTELSAGWYKLAGHADDRDTLGELILHATATGADPTDDRYVIVPWNPFDAVRLGLSALPNAAPGASGGLPTTDAGNAVKIQTGAAAGQLDLSAGKVSLASTQAFSMTGSITGNIVGNILGNISGSLASLADGAISADALSDAAAGKIADAVFAHDTDGLTFESATVAMLATLLGTTVVAGASVQFKQRDGGTKVTITYGTTAGERTVSVVA